jgi:hypothetical protein
VLVLVVERFPDTLCVVHFLERGYRAGIDTLPAICTVDFPDTMFKRRADFRIEAPVIHTEGADLLNLITRGYAAAAENAF